MDSIGTQGKNLRNGGIHRQYSILGDFLPGTKLDTKILRNQCLKFGNYPFAPPPLFSCISLLLKHECPSPPKYAFALRAT